MSTIEKTLKTNDRSNTAILGIATKVPYKMSQSKLLEITVDKLRNSEISEARINRIFDSARIGSRGMANKGAFKLSARLEERFQDYVNLALPLALETVREALEHASTEESEIEKLIFVTSTGFSSPGLDYLIARALNLPKTCSRTVVQFNGCAAGITGLRVADDFCRLNPGKKCLLVCLELTSIHANFRGDLNSVILHTIFGDACAVTVLQSGIEEETWRLSGFGSYLIDDSHDGIEIRLDSEAVSCQLSPNLARHLEANIEAGLENLLESCNLGRDQVEAWACHPGGTRIIEAVENGYGLDYQVLEDAWETLRDHGNTLSCGIFFVLQKIFAKEVENAVAFSFAPGVSIESVYIIQS
jgi:alpha-pyrone synthase